jgi:hypothetical protein
MDERRALTLLAWIMGGVLLSVFFLNAVALASLETVAS